ncbi:MAG: class I mannose-6-phosphate isomerase [Lachnospiraceae bacterium]|nr:class I mannose-6-phosphate isomerase [Lachnospiraceae bacterium]MDE6186297.1 class I mannose-6-phosphate isomerase [Lachnospiraceae bacterium]
MINKSIHLNSPFLLKPCGKNYLWGGSRLNDDFAKGIDMFPLAETWECSTHLDGPSIVASGKDKGNTLADVIHHHPEYLGDNHQKKEELPILVKFIDARDDLSVQVHPDDDYAMKYENGSLGKNEFWYVLDAAEDAKLVYGLSRRADAETLKKSIEDGTVEKYLQRVPIKKDDVFYIKAGTIHAIGGGALIAEVQESSNLTYRMYDYDRVDAQGEKRKLHVDKALEVADLEGGMPPGQILRVLKFKPGCATEFLCRCKYFQVERMLINTERLREMVSFRTTILSFQVLLCINGCGTLFYGNCEAIHFFKGDCIFIPASSVTIKIHGKAQFLKISC